MVSTVASCTTDSGSIPDGYYMDVLLRLYLLTFRSIVLSTLDSVSFSGVYNAKKYEGIGAFDLVFLFAWLCVGVYSRFRNFAVTSLNHMIVLVIWEAETGWKKSTTKC